MARMGPTPEEIAAFQPVGALPKAHLALIFRSTDALLAEQTPLRKRAKRTRTKMKTTARTSQCPRGLRPALPRRPRMPPSLPELNRTTAVTPPVTTTTISPYRRVHLLRAQVVLRLRLLPEQPATPSRSAVPPPAAAALTNPFLLLRIPSHPVPTSGNRAHPLTGRRTPASQPGRPLPALTCQTH